MARGDFKNVILILISAALVQKTETCGSVGSGTDNQLYQNPTLTWTMNPPSSWTYPVSYALTTSQYFPGQPLTKADAQNQANGDITAAALEALTQNNLPTQGVRIIANYQAQMVSDCVKIAGTAPLPTMSTQGSIFGIVESGAVVQLATVGATKDSGILLGATALTPALCIARTFTGVTLQSNIIQASLTINGISLIGSQLRLVAAQIQTQLNFANHVQFVTPITFS